MSMAGTNIFSSDDTKFSRGRSPATTRHFAPCHKGWTKVREITGTDRTCPFTVSGGIIQKERIYIFTCSHSEK